MERNLYYDVVVVGGGPAGIGASVGAAKTGVKVLLLEKNPYLGGEGTNSNITAFCGFYTRGEKPLQVVKGVGEDILRRLHKYGEKAKEFISPMTGNVSVKFSPEILKLVYDDIVVENNIDALYHTQMIEVNKEDSFIKSIVCFDNEGKYTINAKSFIDTTGEGNLAFLAGENFEYGDENGNLQHVSLSIRVENLPENADITPETLKKAILTAKENGDTILEKEWGIIIRNNDTDTFGYYTIPSTQIDGIDAKSLTKAEIILRQQALHYISALKNHLPHLKNIRIASTGPSLGIRESRRIICEKSISIDDVFSRKSIDDSIARGSWSPEIHKGKGVKYMHINDYEYFYISIGSLKPLKTRNLWCAGRCIGCDTIGHSSIRVMGTCLATGHGAGVAAALTLDSDNIDIKKIQQELINQNALI